MEHVLGHLERDRSWASFTARSTANPAAP